jgi:hypothetical protein
MWLRDDVRRTVSECEFTGAWPNALLGSSLATKIGAVNNQGWP